MGYYLMIITGVTTIKLYTYCPLHKCWGFIVCADR